MADTIVDVVVKKLTELGLEEIIFQLTIKAEIQKVATQLEIKKGYVAHLGSRGKQDTEVAEKWVNQLRETSLQLDDLVDEFLLDMELVELNTCPFNLCEVKSLIATVQSFGKRVKIQFCFHQQLRAMSERLKDLEDEKSICNVQLKTNEGSNNELLVHSGSGYMEGIEAVGIDMEVERIAGMIEKRSDDQVKVITIWGAGGSGKTTLAKQVHERVKNDCYSCWVDVSHSSDIVYVLRETIKGLYKSIGTNPPPQLQLEKADRSSLQQHLLDYLVGRRYVVFFDDVWDRNLLSQIKFASNRGSSIIITSRYKDIGVGSFLGAAPHYVEVKPLEFDLASTLFCKLAFPGTCSWPNDTIKEAGEKLVRKCSGLPVAILAMARLMSTKGTDDLREWRDALDSLDLELEGSLASVNRAVLLSYNELPTHLKSCFLYCALFPKTYYIPVAELILMCIAEGFINEEEGHGSRTVEEIGRNYFLQLKYRSLLQFEEEMGRIEMHDLYRDVACEVIRREMFAEITVEQNTKLDWKKRRLFILDHKEPVVKLDNMKKLRTLFINYQAGISLRISFPQMLQSIKLLRLLILTTERFDEMEEVPDEMGNLIHLRYLRLNSPSIRRLPDSLGRLRNLQTLDIFGTNVKSLPKSLSELKQLRHLFGHNLEVPDMVFTFSQLQTLFGICISTNDQARELANITQLTTLDINLAGEVSWRAICASLQKLTNLRSLYISLLNFTGSVWEYGNYFSPPLHLENLVFINLGKLAKFTSTLTYLRSITIRQCAVDEDFFISLEKLPSLMLLDIEYYIGEKLLCSAGSFPKLNKLETRCSKVTKWEIRNGAMKCLHSLIMFNCTSLQMLPQGLTQLQSLKQLHLWGTSQELVDSISVGGVDRWKVQHIPRIFIQPDSGQESFLLS